MNAIRRAFGACLLAVVFTAAVLLTPRVARAGDDAESHWNNGVSLYGEGDYPASLVEFKRAYEIQPNYNFLYNIAQVQWTLKDYVSAVKTYQQYLVDGGARIGATRKAEVEKDIATGKGRIATVTITVNAPGAEVFIDDVSIGTAPFKEPVQVNSGKRKFVASRDGFNPARELKDFAGGDNGSITLNLVELKPGETPKPVEVTPPGGTGNGTGTPITPPPPPPSPSAAGPVITFVLTGGFAIAWGVSGGLALSADSELNTLKQQSTTKEALTDAADKATTLAIVSDVMMVTTIVGAGVATAVTIATFSGGAKDEKSGKVDLKVGVGRVGLKATF